MSIQARIIKDSINSATNDRLTTWILTYPRFIHSELLTHKMLSKNSASSRAIPSKKIIEMVMEDPAMPQFWGKNQSGMQAAEELDDQIKKVLEIPFQNGDKQWSLQTKKTDREAAKYLWLQARGKAVESVEKLTGLGLHKQITNRILEPWFNITILCSGTEWENFFALRAHKDSQPEFRVLAKMMLEEYNRSIPEIKRPYDGLSKFEKNHSVPPYEVIKLLCEFEKDWHIPFGDKMPEGLYKLDQLKVAIARGARLSYLTFDGEMNVERDFAIYDKLLNSDPKHCSPAEHLAFPISESKFVGNFKGWYQFRKLLPNENAKDPRVIKRRVVDGKVV